MSRLRKEVAYHAERARTGHSGLYYSRVVQIEFNAWHYMEANLWASLVDHIFRNLRLTTSESPEEEKRRRDKLLEHLDAALAERATAEVRVQTAEIERD